MSSLLPEIALAEAENAFLTMLADEVLVITPGKTITATVLSTDPATGTVNLAIGNTSLTATSNLPLQSGQQVDLQVKSVASGQIVLSLASQGESESSPTSTQSSVSDPRSEIVVNSIGPLLTSAGPSGGAPSPAAPPTAPITLTNPVTAGESNGAPVATTQAAAVDPEQVQASPTSSTTVSASPPAAVTVAIVTVAELELAPLVGGEAASALTSALQQPAIAEQLASAATPAMMSTAMQAAAQSSSSAADGIALLQLASQVQNQTPTGQAVMTVVSELANAAAHPEQTASPQLAAVIAGRALAQLPATASPGPALLSAVRYVTGSSDPVALLRALASSRPELSSTIEQAAQEIVSGDSDLLRQALSRLGLGQSAQQQSGSTTAQAANAEQAIERGALSSPGDTIRSLLPPAAQHLVDGQQLLIASPDGAQVQLSLPLPGGDVRVSIDAGSRGGANTPQRTQIDLQLAAIGRVQIELIGHQGALFASVRSPDPTVRKLLADAAPELEAALSSINGQAAKVYVDELPEESPPPPITAAEVNLYA